MAIKAVTNSPAGQRSRVFNWLAMANGDSGAPITYQDYGGDASVTFDGTFGAGGSITFEGSNDGANYYPMTDAQGNAVTKTAAAMEVLEEAPLWIRPRVTAGDGTTSLSCKLLTRRTA